MCCCQPNQSPCGSPCGAVPPVNPPFVQALNLTEQEAQGVSDFCKDLLAKVKDIFGCAERTERGQPTVLSEAHHTVTRSLLRAFPEADSSCVSNAVAGIVNALGEACASFPDQTTCTQVFFQKASPHIGQLLVCLFGQQRAMEIQLSAYNAFLTACLPQLISVCMPLLCGNLTGGLCPVPTPPSPPIPPSGPSLNDVSRCGGGN